MFANFDTVFYIFYLCIPWLLINSIDNITTLSFNYPTKSVHSWSTNFTPYLALYTCLITQSCLSLLIPWDSPGKNTGMGCHTLLQGIFSTQRLNLHLLSLLHGRQILYSWHHWMIYFLYSIFRFTNGIFYFIYFLISSLSCLEKFLWHFL